MNIHNLNALFSPQRIALFGVTQNIKSVGGMVLKNLVGSGYRGVVYPVNPTSESVLGIPCYKEVHNLPQVPDLGIICTPAPQVPELVGQCGEAGIRGLIILSAGFKEIGEAGEDLEAQIFDAKRKYDGMRIIGPNCLGIIVPKLSLNASFAGAMPKKGTIAFISQSGALNTSVLDWALDKKIGFSAFVSIGNALDVDFGDLIDYLGEDEDTKSIILYVESIAHARKFMTAARAVARNKPIIVYKSGRYPESAEVASSHTGAMIAEDTIYDAAFKRAGLVRVFNIDEIFDCTELLGRQKKLQGTRLGIITNAGGPGVMAVDALIEGGGNLAPLTTETLEKLDAHLPSAWSHKNPVDVLGDARAKRYVKAVEIVLQDKDIDAILSILTPQAMTNPTAMAKLLGQLSETSSKPLLAAWMGGESMREGIKILNEAGIAAYETPEQAVGAFLRLVSYKSNLESLYETPKDIPVEFTLDRSKIRSQFESSTPLIKGILSEEKTQKLISGYGIPVARTYRARNSDEAAAIAREIGFPVVMKISASDVIHKTDLGGVALNLRSEAAVRETFAKIKSSYNRARPGAAFDGVALQPMYASETGVELIIGVKKDSLFGTVVLAGAGGIAAELYGDKAIGFPPLNERLARKMLESLKIWPLLTGFRGRKPLPVDGLVETIIRISYLAADYPEIVELDINPLLVTPEEIVALDTSALIHHESAAVAPAPYSHLALRPYPEEYVRTETLRDGNTVTLRPIKPEDEPLWFELLRSCTRESIYQRFRYFFHWDSHDVASRFCYIDYDREMAIVAEFEENGRRQLLGVGRLIADPDRDTAEYAILITDLWQNKGLGSKLTDYCVEIAKNWGVKKVVAQTTTDNNRMISLFRKKYFDITIDHANSLVEVEKEVA